MAALYHSFLVALFVGFVYAAAPRHAPAIIEDLRQDSRVVAGWPASDGQIPYQVSVRMVSALGAVSSCGGSIIHHNWVITAAHCVANRITFVVRLGLTNLTKPEFIVESTDKHIYPTYNEISAGVQTDDIALLGLERSIPYGSRIQPCRLQSSEQKNTVYTGVRLTVSGFGRTDDTWNGGVASEVLLWTHLLGITNEECRSWYGGSTIIQDQTVCAAYYNDTAQSSCQGDSGGPLTVVDEDGQPTMIGIVSFGSSAGCNSPFPSAYVRPGHYHDWYVEITGISFDWTSDDLEATTEGDSATTEGDSATTEGDSATTEGDSATTEGDSATTEGDSATTEGDSATTEGDSATTEGDSATTEGDTATTEGDSY